MSPILNTCTRCSVQGMYGTWKYGAGTLPGSMEQVQYLAVWSRYITWQYGAGTLPRSMKQVHYLEVWSRCRSTEVWAAAVLGHGAAAVSFLGEEEDRMIVLKTL